MVILFTGNYEIRDVRSEGDVVDLTGKRFSVEATRGGHDYKPTLWLTIDGRHCIAFRSGDVSIARLLAGCQIDVSSFLAADRADVLIAAVSELLNTEHASFVFRVAKGEFFVEYRNTQLDLTFGSDVFLGHMQARLTIREPV